MGTICLWMRSINSMGYDTNCGHYYNPYIKFNGQPRTNGTTCPWCGRQIGYKEEYDGNPFEDSGEE